MTYDCKNLLCRPCMHETTSEICPVCKKENLIIAPNRKHIFCPDYTTCDYERYDLNITIPADVLKIYSKNGSMIRAWRTHKKITQTQMAERLSISRTSYGMIERGDRGYNEREVKRVAEAFGFDIDYLKAPKEEKKEEAPLPGLWD